MQHHLMKVTTRNAHFSS